MTRGGERRPILVTGSHRSGSTWIGQMLSASGEAGYVHEPFNIYRGPGICRARFSRWYTYIPPGTDGELTDEFRRLLAFRYNYRAQALSIRSSDDLKALVRDGGRFLRFRSKHVRPLLKDPMALFSAEWIAEAFDAHVVVVVRHPAAFASSVKLDGWAHPFSHFSDQPALIEDHLQPFKDEITAFAREEHDILEQAALLWRLIHSTIAGYRSAHPEWLFVRHEDLSRDSAGGFGNLYEALGLRYTDQARDAVLRSSSPSNSIDRDTNGRLFLARNSRANVDNWRRRLTSAEIDLIRTRVADVSSLFYGDDEW